MASLVAQQLADASMCVLHVVHGVGRVLLLSNIDVEVNRLLGGAAQHVVARSVDADFVDELFEGDHFASTLGHTNGLAVAEEVDQLAEHNFERAREAHGGQNGSNASDVAMMVGAPDIDQNVETTLFLPIVVRNVGREVGVVAISLAHNAVFLVAVLGRLEPHSAILLVDVTLVLQVANAVFKRALAVELIGRQIHFTLGLPTLEVVAEAIGDVVEHLHDVGVAELTELDHALMLVGVFPLVAIAIDDFFCDVVHVQAVVAALGNSGIFMAELLQIASGNGQAKLVHLNAVVVDVELFEDFIASMAHKVCGCGAQSSPAAMANMHGARGVCGDVLDIHLALAFGLRALAIIGALLANLRDDVLHGNVLQTEVDKARACDFDVLNKVIRGNAVNDRLRDFTRVLLGFLGATQRSGAGPIAMALVARTLERNFGNVLNRQSARFAGSFKRFGKKLSQFFAWLH